MGDSSRFYYSTRNRFAFLAAHGLPTAWRLTFFFTPRLLVHVLRNSRLRSIYWIAVRDAIRDRMGQGTTGTS